jgi:hypothetical protein
MWVTLNEIKNAYMFSAIDEGSIGHVNKKILVYDIERDDSVVLCLVSSFLFLFVDLHGTSASLLYVYFGYQVSLPI